MKPRVLTALEVGVAEAVNEPDESRVFSYEPSTNNGKRGFKRRVL